MQLGWIDFSKEERNKVLATLRLLGNQTALDELGIGSVRDAYANILFPGISTIQTRAKYFVLIPYVFALAEKQSCSRTSDFAKWINNFEDRLVSVLVNNSDPKSTGIIGGDAIRQNRTVKMKPSNIYWNGLRTFGIIRNNKTSFSQACNLVMAKSKRRKANHLILDGETFDDHSANQGDNVLFSPLVPDYNVEKESSIDLTQYEAKFLYDKITKAIASKDSLLAFCIKHKLNFNSYEEIDVRSLPADIKKDYTLAKSFADFIFGAHIRYNVIFSKDEDADVKKQFDKWKAGFDFNNLDLDAILGRVNCNYGLRKFCTAFRKLLIDDDVDGIDELIVAREKAVKGDRAKLGKREEYPHYSPVHNYKLNYRFGSARVIIKDIIEGLEVDNG